MDRRGRGDKARVLVVDDEADIRELLDLTWRAWDCGGLCGHGRRGQGFLEREEYSLCLTDMRFPTAKDWKSCA
jgi:two-component system response regulator PilR (NtrC family)